MTESSTEHVHSPDIVIQSCNYVIFSPVLLVIILMLFLVIQYLFIVQHGGFMSSEEQRRVVASEVIRNYLYTSCKHKTEARSENHYICMSIT